MRDLPERIEVTATLDPRPRYKGTSHDDATARAMGFRAALLPGVFVYGHATRPAVIGWGEDWLARGQASVRFRRPVFHGDPLVVRRGPVTAASGALTASVTVSHADTGEVVLDGSIGLAARAPAPPQALPILPAFAPRRAIGPGAVPEGLQLGSGETVLSPQIVTESLADFHETAPIFADRKLVHSGCLIRATMGDALGNLLLPMPVIFTGVTVTHLAAVPQGAVCRTSARITLAWETRGKHYFETEEWLIADGRPVACHLRQNLYAITEQPGRPPQPAGGTTA
ncbi:MAG: MaoC family dehydratase [Paracoccaceae bacterium]|nr:MAG: MaoC family dehydratase [Paracoccaceae bacterium]